MASWPSFKCPKCAREWQSREAIAEGWCEWCGEKTEGGELVKRRDGTYWVSAKAKHERFRASEAAGAALVRMLEGRCCFTHDQFRAAVEDFLAEPQGVAVYLPPPTPPPG